MKFRGFRLRLNNKSGIIMIIVLWILVILSALAIGLGRRTSADLTLAKYAVGRLKANAFSWAGIIYAINQIRQSADDKKATLYSCGISIEEGEEPENLFKQISLKDGYFSISYILKEDSRDLGHVCYAFQDEERRINLNSIHSGNYRFLSHAIMLLGFDSQIADTIAAGVADWQDADSEIIKESMGAEDNTYMSMAKPYHCKNKPFDSVNEILLVNGMTKDVFFALKDYITVFPKDDTQVLINVNTASEIVLKSLFRFVIDNNPTLDQTVGDRLTEKIILYRQGEDHRSCTDDDRFISTDKAKDMELNAQELALFLSATQALASGPSQYFRINVQGVDSTRNIFSEVQIVAGREYLNILLWHRN